MSEMWEEVARRLTEVSAIVEQVAEDAAQLIGDVQHRDPNFRKLDPRSSTVAAAQFVSSLQYEAKSLADKAERIAQAEDAP